MNPNPTTFTRFQAVALAAVILFTLGIVFPVATRARSSGKSTVCLANLNMLGRAWLAYANDNDGKLVNGMVPRSSEYKNLSYWLTTTTFNGPYKDNAWWVNPPHNASGVYAGDPIPCSLGDEDNGIRSGKLYPYVGTSAAYHCPGDRGYLQTLNRTGKRSYSITGLMHGEMPNSPDIADRYRDIRNPAAKTVFVESTDDRGWNMGSWIMNAAGSQPSWIDPVVIHHQNSTGLLFADGHGNIHSWVDNSTIHMALEQGMVPINWAGGEGKDVLYMAGAYFPKR